MSVVMGRIDFECCPGGASLMGRAGLAVMGRDPRIDGVGGMGRVNYKSKYICQPDLIKMGRSKRIKRSKRSRRTSVGTVGGVVVDISAGNRVSVKTGGRSIGSEVSAVVDIRRVSYTVPARVRKVSFPRSLWSIRGEGRRRTSNRGVALVSNVRRMSAGQAVVVSDVGRRAVVLERRRVRSIRINTRVELVGSM
jgi:hypothetical protein